MNSLKVLVIDEDPDLRRMLTLDLESDGYRVTAVRTGREALKVFAKEVPDLVLLDLLLPDLHGFEVCRKMKRYCDVPIVILSSVATEETMVEALRRYAEDYVVKPCRYPLLSARIERVLKRTASIRPRWSFQALNGHLAIDFAKHRVRIGAREAKLTPIESRILTCLGRTPNNLVSTERLVNEVWPEGDGDAERLRVHVRSLRTKIEPDPANPRYLLTQRGDGYLFAVSKD